MYSDVLDALSAYAEFLSGPPLTPEPVMTPARWSRMACRKGTKRVPVSLVDAYSSSDVCRCDFCIWRAENNFQIQNWMASQRLRPPYRKVMPFGSVSSAMEALIYHARGRAKLTGGTAMALDSLNRGPRSSNKKLPDIMKHADLAIDIERCVMKAFADPYALGMFMREVAMEIVLDSFDPSTDRTATYWSSKMNVSEESIKRLISRMKKRISSQLREFDLIP